MRDVLGLLLVALGAAIVYGGVTGSYRQALKLSIPSIDTTATDVVHGVVRNGKVTPS